MNYNHNIIDILTIDDSWPDMELESFVEKILTALDIRQCEMSISLANDETIRELNNEYRGKDRATNVLSFPQLELTPGEPPPKGEHIGDIMVSLETIKHEAETQNISFESHLHHMIVHGILHLLGYDHQEDKEAETMEALEKKLLAN